MPIKKVEHEIVNAMHRERLDQENSALGVGANESK